MVLVWEFLKYFLHTQVDDTGTTRFHWQTSGKFHMSVTSEYSIKSVQTRFF